MPDPTDGSPGRRSRPVVDVAFLSASAVNTMAVLAIVSLVVANRFGIGRYGVFAFVLTSYNALALVGASGLAAALLVFIPKHHGDEALQRKFVGSALLVAALTGGVLAVLLATGATSVESFFQLRGLGRALRWIAVAVPFAIVNKVLAGMLIGRHHATRVSGGEAVRMWTFLGCAVFAVVRGDYFALFAAFAIADFVHCCVQVGMCRGVLGGAWPGALPSKDTLVTTLRFVRHAFVGTALGQVNASLDVLMVSFFLNERALGVYSTAVLFVRGASLVPLALQRVYTPLFTRAVRDGLTAALTRYVSSVPKIAAAVVGVTMLVLAGGYPEIVGLLFPNKPEYAESFAAFLALAPGAVFLTLTSSVFSLATISADHAEYVPRISAVSLVTNGVCNAFAIPIFGVVGCGVATVLGQLAALVVTRFYLRRTVELGSVQWSMWLMAGVFTGGFVAVYFARGAFGLGALMVAPVVLAWIVAVGWVRKDDVRGFGAFTDV